MEKIERLKELLKLQKTYQHALGIMYFDFETICPKDSREEESDTLNYFSNELFKLSHSEEMKKLIVDLYSELDSLKDPLDKVLVSYLYKSYMKTKNISPEFDMKMNEVFSASYMKWLDAKEKNDYSIFKDIFKEVLEIQEQALLLRENKLDDLYDNLLDDCEEGMLQEDLDPFFNELKEGLIELINKIKNSKHKINTSFVNRKVPLYKQEEFSKYLLELNGYDFNKGLLSTTEHPFTSSVGQNDARVTTHYYEDMFLSNIFSVIHEGGHAIFMQNEPSEDYKHYINDHISNGMHESVSRFYENVIGRSKAYIHLIYPKFKEVFKDEFSDITEEELYEAVNEVKPDLIRTEADEVTYGLHIIIRYEMEKMIMKKEISLDEIESTWNRLYKEYLGVDVPSVSQGVLQDVHWTSGFGYFPSYAIGNCYNAMYVKEMNKEFNLEEEILKGNFKLINSWMKEHVFKDANHLTPKEWIKAITDKSLSPKDFLEYLNKKYSEIYRF